MLIEHIKILGLKWLFGIELLWVYLIFVNSNYKELLKYPHIYFCIVFLNLCWQIVILVEEAYTLSQIDCGLSIVRQSNSKHWFLKFSSCLVQTSWIVMTILQLERRYCLSSPVRVFMILVSCRWDFAILNHSIISSAGHFFARREISHENIIFLFKSVIKIEIWIIRVIRIYWGVLILW